MEGFPEMIKEILLQLYDIGAIKSGTFTLKSGITSPFYIDLRECISFPPLLKAVAESIWKLISPMQFDCLCGVPYTALPIASYLSIAYNTPMIMRRKEAKDHGTKKIIEGTISPGKTCLIIEDLITSGASIFETIAPIEDAGMQVRDVAVFLDREQGGRQRLAQKGYSMHAVVTLTQMLEILHQNGRINQETKSAILNFIKTNSL
jgi:orotate phosphoribosyltransferase